MKSLYYESGVQAPASDNTTSPISLTTIESGERAVRTIRWARCGPFSARTNLNTRESPSLALRPTAYSPVDSCGVPSAAPPSPHLLPLPHSRSQAPIRMLLP
jgi:hypothetical protein